MSSSVALEHLREVNRLTKQITRHSSNIRNSSNDYRFNESSDISSLEEKLVVMNVYLEKAISELEWAQKIKLKIKSEFTMMLFMMDVVLCAWIILHHVH
jgi:hypothetical protein